MISRSDRGIWILVLPVCAVVIRSLSIEQNQILQTPSLSSEEIIIIPNALKFNFYSKLIFQSTTTLTFFDTLKSFCKYCRIFVKTEVSVISLKKYCFNFSLTDIIVFTIEINVDEVLGYLFFLKTYHYGGNWGRSKKPTDMQLCKLFC